MANVDVDALLRGERRALAKAITLVESQREQDRQQAQALLQQILPHTGNSVRIGITGVPGVGKSTFIELFGLHLIELGKRVAVLAIDPSSPRVGGSILGDKTRMEQLARAEQAFIRPSPAGSTLGGVAQNTREAMLLCEAAGFDVILVETVGVGQSEHQVASMVDFFLMLLLPNAGDELQGIKRGIMELADAVVVNKADGDALPAAKRARAQYQSALELIQHSSYWTPRVLTCTAHEKASVAAVWEVVCDYVDSATACGALAEQRMQQARAWMHQLVQELMMLRLRQHPGYAATLARLERDVIGARITPMSAAVELVGFLAQ